VVGLLAVVARPVGAESDVVVALAEEARGDQLLVAVAGRVTPLVAPSARPLRAKVDVMARSFAIVANVFGLRTSSNGVTRLFADAAGLRHAVRGPVLDLADRADDHRDVALGRQVIRLVALQARRTGTDRSFVRALALQADEARVNGALLGEVTFGFTLAAKEIWTLSGGVIVALANRAPFQATPTLANNVTVVDACLSSQLSQHFLNFRFRWRLSSTSTSSISLIFVGLVQEGVVLTLAACHQALPEGSTLGHFVPGVETVDAGRA
jgi:hypothetical protein